MRTTKKWILLTDKDIANINRTQDEFNKYACTVTDWEGNPMMYLDWVQIVQNPKFQGVPWLVLKEYERMISARNKKK